MLGWRLIFAAAILFPLIGLLVADYYLNFGAPGVWVAPLGLLLALLAAAEVLGLLRAKSHHPAAWSVYCGVTLIFLASCAPVAWGLLGVPYPADRSLGQLGPPLIATAAAVALALVAEMLRYKEPGGVMVNVALAVFTIAYVGVPMSFLVSLRLFHGNQWGMAALVSTVLVVKMSDTGAYAAGRLFGRHKMARRLSPGKTVEGAVGGLVVAAVSAWVFFRFMAPGIAGSNAWQPGWLGCLSFAVVLTAAGMVGDLGESLLKRDMGRKDSSSWLPGLGGVLDVLDSVLMAAPPAFLCWAAGLLGPYV